MTLKEQLQKLIDAQIENQALRFETMGNKKDEALKFRNFAKDCTKKIKSLQNDIDVNKLEIEKLQEIVDAL